MTGTKTPLVPAMVLATLGQEAAACTRCPLYRDATQTVFGEGPPDAELMLVGETPGDREDLAGKPFVGPAGRLLDDALVEAGLDRKRLYITNAVKHFKYQLRGKRRLHKKPNAGEIDACRWWLDRERVLVSPRLIVALGATAIRGLTGKPAAVSSLRGRIETLADGPAFLVTVHPSLLLRLRAQGGFDDEYRRFVSDLGVAAAYCG